MDSGLLQVVDQWTSLSSWSPVLAKQFPACVRVSFCANSTTLTLRSVCSMCRMDSSSNYKSLPEGVGKIKNAHLQCIYKIENAN